MCARVTKMHGDPSRLEEVRKLVGEMKPAIEGVAIAIYDTKESADAAAGTARELVASFSEFFTQAPEVAEYDVDEFWVR